jgi:hypothetical protein
MNNKINLPYTTDYIKMPLCIKKEIIMRILSAILLVSSVMFSAIAFSSTSPSGPDDEDRLVSYCFKVRSASLSERVERACINPNTVSLDFSSIKITDRDLEMIFDALISRRQRVSLDADKLQLINLSHNEVTNEGFLRFLRQLQIGRDGVTPNLRNVVLKTGLTFTDGLIESMQETASHLLDEGLQILE